MIKTSTTRTTTKTLRPLHHSHLPLPRFHPQDRVLQLLAHQLHRLLHLQARHHEHLLKVQQRAC